MNIRASSAGADDHFLNLTAQKSGQHGEARYVRMWMVPPETLCRKHLLGEHVELHMLLGSMSRGKHIDGFLSGGLVDPQRLFGRHEMLVHEMTRRGYTHNSPMDEAECAVLAERYKTSAPSPLLDAAANAAELRRRCADCAQRQAQHT